MLDNKMLDNNMKVRIINIFTTILKVIGILLALGYLWALHHVVYVDEETKKESFIKNLGSACYFLLWIILLLLSGVSIREITK